MTGKRDLWDERSAGGGASAPGGGVAPRDVAVALSYDPGTDTAPKVVAGGKGAMARQILDMAFAHGVKVRTDPDLVQILAALEVDSVIPTEAFLAVAEILAYVYRANGGPPPAVPPGGTLT